MIEHDSAPTADRPFPPGFLWGMATAGHQVEGGNTASDCWAVEHVSDSIFPEASGDAADFYHRYREDIELAAALGFKALRFSLEWSRIEPEPGWYSRSALDHYRRVAATCREFGLVTVVTFNHWTTPVWFAAEGGWQNHGSVEAFTRFVDRAARHLSGEVDWAITLNEPNVAAVLARDGAVAAPAGDTVAALAAAARRHPGGPLGFRPMMLWEGDHLDRYSSAHRGATEAIKAVKEVPVGWSLACEDYQARPGGEERMSTIRRRALDDWLEVSRDDDFVGVQNYTRRLVSADGIDPVPEGSPANDLGWELYPPSLAHAVRHAAQLTGRPVLITEHGVATWDDRRRIEHTEASLHELGRVIGDGVDVRGYLHWTFLDEFEWFAGYRVTFGVVEVNRRTFARTPRESARWLGRVAGANSLHEPQV